MVLDNFQDQTWDRLRRDVQDLRSRVSRNELHEQAQVGRAVPRYANYASLPAGAAFGDWGCTTDTHRLYWHNGTTWRYVPDIDPALVFTIQNALTDVAYDADSTTVAELADALATLITGLGLT